MDILLNREPGLLWKPRAWLMLWFPIAAVTVMHVAADAGAAWQHDIIRRLYYVPIVLGAFAGGLQGALAASGVASLLYVPHAFFLLFGTQDPARGTEKLMEIVLYNVIAVITGALADRERRERNRLRLTAERLSETLEEVQERSLDLTATRDVTFHGLAALAEYRDSETGAHIVRTQHYILALAQMMATQRRFSAYLTEAVIELLFKSAPLHDIGKVGVPDQILLKPGPLTPEEYEIMKKHTIIGRDALANAERRLQSHNSTAFLVLAKDIAASHHERWDGSGYPFGLKGDDIPIAGRLMKICDVYDALVTRRVYKPAYTHDAAMRIITFGEERVRPAHFDPDVLQMFTAQHATFRDIAARFSGGDTRG
ncbi:HD domain-containing protein [bacterium]|nr:HD domain-containing protein [bacterium]